MDTFEEAALKVLETYDGTPQELGFLLYRATMPTYGESPRVAEKTRARNTLMSYEGGIELLNAHDRLIEQALGHLPPA